MCEWMGVNVCRVNIWEMKDGVEGSEYMEAKHGEKNGKNHIK